MKSYPNPLTPESLPMPADRVNNFWYAANESETVVVFVHGIFSDSRGCWLFEDRPAGRRVFWPDLIRKDTRLGDPSIFLGGFYTAIDAGDFSVAQCARELREALERTDADCTPPVLDWEKLVFVCHSTGGIVVRYMIERDKELFRDKALGLALIASPSLGSVWANVASLAGRYYNQRLGLQLRWQGETLEDIHGRFRDLVNNKAKVMPRLFGMEACENQMILVDSLPAWVRWLLPNRLKVVTTLSAGQYFGEVKVLRGTDHFSTVKPDGLNHPAHEFLVTFMERFHEVSDPLRPIARPRPVAQLPVGRRAALAQAPSPLTRQALATLPPSTLPDGLDPASWAFVEVLSARDHPDSVVERYRGKDADYVVKRTEKKFCHERALNQLVGQRMKTWGRVRVEIVTPLAVWTAHDFLWEIQPFYAGISLHQLVIQNRYRLRGDYIGLLVSRLFEVTELLHGKGILHRDIRPQNLLLGPDGNVALVDCTFCCQADARQIPVDNPSFSPPELKQGRAIKQSDWFSIAATAFFIANGFPPDADDQTSIRAGLEHLDLGPHQAIGFDPGKYGTVIQAKGALFEALMNPDPAMRPAYYHEIALTERTVVPADEIYGILDAGVIGYLIVPRTVDPHAIPVVIPRGEIKTFLAGGAWSTKDRRLKLHIKQHLAGNPPWLAT